jgi:secreted PhoX family phosphatase
MTRAEVRALLDEGTLYVAHFAGLDNTTGATLLDTGQPPTEAAPGQGQWIEMSVTSVDAAPADALGAPGTTVGQALQDVNWNNIGGFPTDNDVRLALWTAATKIGVMELNRPEDIEWNANDPSGTPLLYVAFTNHGRQVALDQNGVLFDPTQHETQSPTRPDPVGSIFAMQEGDPANPATSKTFAYFMVWQGAEGQGPLDTANPDNLLLDAQGGVWFGTDGNFGLNGTADGLYYLDLDPAHQSGQPGIVMTTFGQAFRVVAGPGDSEFTGPAFNADMTTLFSNIQHPGESFDTDPSTWPPR